MLFTPIKIMFICRANRLLCRTPAKAIIQHLKGISHFVLYYLDANTILVVTNLIFPSIFLFYSLYYIFLFPFNLCHSFNIVFPIISPNIQPIPLWIISSHSNSPHLNTNWQHSITTDTKNPYKKAFLIFNFFQKQKVIMRPLVIAR